jgi:RHS repeat-associated protein
VTYLHGPGIDEPLAREAAGVRTYYHADGLGSIVERTDATGSVIASHTYDSFGQALGLGNGYAYTGREWDGEDALLYYRARHYDPKIGRFVSEDPIKWAGGINLYAYVRNGPTNLIDPSGKQSQDLKDFYDALPKRRPVPTGVPDNCLDSSLFSGAMVWRVFSGGINDKVGHCLFHCEIVKRCGSIGKVTSLVAGFGKEILDDMLRDARIYGDGWDDDDITANTIGASCPASQSCTDRCWNANLQIHGGHR